MKRDLLKTVAVTAVAFVFTAASMAMAACPDGVVCFGSGGETGEFYRTANILKQKAEEQLIPIEVGSPGGSKFNCDNVKAGNLHFGWAMQKVAEAEGMNDVMIAPFSEAMLLVGQEKTITFLGSKSKLRTWETLLNMKRLRLAVLGGMDSGEASFAISHGLDKSRIQSFTSEADFLNALKSNPNMVGFVSRYPNPYSKLMQAIDKEKLKVTGVLSRSLIKEGLKAGKVTIPGFGEVSTVMMPVVAVFDSSAQYSVDVAEMVDATKDILKGMSSEDFSPQPTWTQKAWLKIKGWKSQGLVKFEELKAQI
ncbi:MAG: hypothetical protein ACKUBY_05935 [Candidatus Moraniibacteriota bacterium]|jgi:hypothetical protein